MNMDEKIKRINALYHKQQNSSLTEQERQEQADLRRDYVQSIRTNLRSALKQVSVVEEDGSVSDLVTKKKGEEAE